MLTDRPGQEPDSGREQEPLPERRDVAGRPAALETHIGSYHHPPEANRHPSPPRPGEVGESRNPRLRLHGPRLKPCGPSTRSRNRVTSIPPATTEFW
jgi:hypothetical protein